jgi:hypothetical protein
VQPPRACRASNRRGPSVPAAEAGRPCRQQRRAGRAGSHRGPAVPAATAAGRASSRREPAVPEAAAGRLGRPGRQPWADVRRPDHWPQAAVAGCVDRGARRELHLLPTASPAGGRRWEWRGGKGTCELGLCSLSHPSHVRSRTFRRMHGPQGTDRHIRTAAALRACARAERRARAERSGARRSARGSTAPTCMHAERRARVLAARFLAVHARRATHSVSRAHSAPTMA